MEEKGRGRLMSEGIGRGRGEGWYTFAIHGGNLAVVKLRAAVSQNLGNFVKAT